MSQHHPAQVAKVVHHREYYLRGGDITFLVENHLFRVHSYFFDRESTYFHNKLSAASAPGASRVGASDQDAFTLENVRSVDFERFLWVFYNPKYSLYHKSVDEWTSILGLANEWSFVEVKALAIRELEQLEIAPIEKIYLYHKYFIDRAYLITSYGAVCIRPDPLNLLEGTKLGLEVSLKIAEARERVRAITADKGGPRSPTFADFVPTDVEEVVRTVFNINTPTPISATTPGGANGSHSRSNSNSHDASPQSPINLRTSASNFGLWTNTQSPTNGFGDRTGEQSPVNGTASTGAGPFQSPQGGSGEPPSTLVGDHLSPTEGEREGAGAMDGLETPVDGAGEMGSGAAAAASGEVEAEEAAAAAAAAGAEAKTPVDTFAKNSSNLFSNLGDDAEDDGEDEQEQEGAEVQDDKKGHNNPFPKRDGGGGGNKRGDRKGAKRGINDRRDVGESEGGGAGKAGNGKNVKGTGGGLGQSSKAGKKAAKKAKRGRGQGADVVDEDEHEDVKDSGGEAQEGGADSSSGGDVQVESGGRDEEAKAVNDEVKAQNGEMEVDSNEARMESDEVKSKVESDEVKSKVESDEAKSKIGETKVENGGAEVESDESRDVNGAAGGADVEGGVDVPIEKREESTQNDVVDADTSKVDADASKQDNADAKDTSGDQASGNHESAQDVTGGDELGAKEPKSTIDDSNASEQVTEGDVDVENNNDAEQQGAAGNTPEPTRGATEPVVTGDVDLADPVTKVESTSNHEQNTDGDSHIGDGAGDEMGSDEEATLSGETLVDNGQIGDDESMMAKAEKRSDLNDTDISSGFSTPYIVFSDDDKEEGPFFDTLES